MILPRALIALALCLSAAAITAPTPTVRDETLISRDYDNGGNDGGNSRGNDGGNHGGNSGGSNDGRSGGSSGDNKSGHSEGGNSGNNDSGHNGGSSGNNDGHSGRNSGGKSGGLDGGNSGSNGDQSGHSGNNGGHSGENNSDHKPTPSHRSMPYRRRALNTMNASEIATEICPEEFFGCPIAAPGSLASLPTSLSDWIAGGYECIDPQADLRACGGCTSLDAKHDCTLIPGVNDISCVAGACVVGSCNDSYKFDAASRTCMPK
ncbi:hypothetical protein BDN70DRAFT_15914 [Pholiota conissans]|uniref:Protein CPL1-like domain-containing protein n=1 Tax=Pholiota conissans TaxID=109636 RepID=A0A9P5ZDW9_9AGAR|nr:hypothetical protein BDN70DRAFT_15914 [Pholiota conissans]